MMGRVPVDARQDNFREREPKVLALDIGTSSVRAALYDETGNEIPGTQWRTASPLLTTPEGGAELHAEEAVEQVARTIDSALAAHDSSIRIEMVAVSCFWHSLVGVDMYGRSLTPVLTWADTRAAREAEALSRRFDERTVTARTGAPFHPSYWPAKLLWLRRSQAEVYKMVARWMSFADFLSLRFFGRVQSSVSIASGTGIFNTRACTWDEELCRELSITEDKLPVIAETDKAFSFLAGNYARRWPQLSEARWFPAIGDGAANNIGAGCTSPERAALMIGTSGAMRVLWEGEPPPELPTGLWCYRADRRRVVAGGALSDGGGLWAWMNEALRLDADAAETERTLAEMEADSHGLTILPFWAGERSMGWSADARGAILGLSLHTRPIEILRAAMEAVAYRFRLIWEALAPLAPGARIIASGGALQASAAWAQILSDVLGRTLEITGAEESSSRGAVLLALEASGKIKSIGEDCAPVELTVEPDMNAHDRYCRGLKRHAQLYERLVSDKETARLINEAAQK